MTLVAGSTELIYVPVLIIRYASRLSNSILVSDASDTSASTSARSLVSFTTIYVHAEHSFQSVAIVMFALTVAAIAVFSFVGVVNMSRTHPRDAIDGHVRLRVTIPIPIPIPIPAPSLIPIHATMSMFSLCSLW